MKYALLIMADWILSVVELLLVLCAGVFMWPANLSREKLSIPVLKAIHKIRKQRGDQ